jgi:PAS domain S-box-containing protein
MRLKTKLVVAVTGLVFLLVTVVAWQYLSQSLQQNVEQSYLSTDIIAHEVLFETRQAIEKSAQSNSIDLSDPGQLREDVATILRKDAALNALLDSVISYSPIVYDITVADSAGRALISTDPALEDTKFPFRPEYATLRFRSLTKIIGVVLGKPRVYDVSLSLDRNQQAFATVHVGIRTTFLRTLFQPWLMQAFTFTAIAIVASLLVAAFVANLALSQIEQISQRLDSLSSHEAEPAGLPAVLGLRRRSSESGDAVVQVSNKIEKIGQRMRNTEEVFSALKENLDQILSNLQDGVVLFTRDARAVLVSDSVERFLGVGRDKILGASALDIFDRQTPLGRLLRDAFEKRKPIDQEELEAEGGRRMSVSLELIQETIEDEQEHLGALLTLHDLESVRAIEGELELSRRLSAIGRLTAGVGHEVKNPINAIVVHLELMRTKLSGEDAPAMRHLSIIHSEIQRLDRVVQTLVDFSRPIELKRREEDLRSIVSSVLMLASAELETHAVEVVSKLPERPVVAKVDADMLRQALLNIVLNGAQAMPAGGVLRIILNEEARYAVLSVKDQGCGIPPDILPRIFDLYFTTKKEGSGIGLAMTYRLVQLHSGFIDVESAEGEGTTFSIRIPLGPAVDRTRDIPDPAHALRGVL